MEIAKLLSKWEHTELSYMLLVTPVMHDETACRARTLCRVVRHLADAAMHDEALVRLELEVADREHRGLHRAQSLARSPNLTSSTLRCGGNAAAMDNDRTADSRWMAKFRLL